MKQRYEWIDLLRGLAVTGMVWVHSANTFLAEAQQEQPWFQGLAFYHGLVAPVFFWVAGYMRGLAAGKQPQPGTPPKLVWPTVKRLLWVWGIGYLLHVPWGPLLQGDFSAPVLRILFQSDVLHCLAASSLLLLVVERGIPARGGQFFAVLTLSLLCLVATDWMATAATGFILLDAYLSKQHGSLFPLFPWVAFAGFGFLSSRGIGLHWLDGLAGVVMAFVLPQVLRSGTVPFFFERLGWVLVLAALLLYLSRWLLDRHLAMPDWLLLLGRQSLVMYVAHLLMIHAVPWWHGQTLDRLIGKTQPVGRVWLIFAGLLAASWLVAWVWDKFRSKPRRIRGS